MKELLRKLCQNRPCCFRCDVWSRYCCCGNWVRETLQI